MDIKDLITMNGINAASEEFFNKTASAYLNSKVEAVDDIVNAVSIGNDIEMSEPTTYVNKTLVVKFPSYEQIQSLRNNQELTAVDFDDQDRLLLHGTRDEIDLINLRPFLDSYNILPMYDNDHLTGDNYTKVAIDPWSFSLICAVSYLKAKYSIVDVEWTKDSRLTVDDWYCKQGDSQYDRDALDNYQTPAETFDESLESAPCTMGLLFNEGNNSPYPTTGLKISAANYSELKRRFNMGTEDNFETIDGIEMAYVDLFALMGLTILRLTDGYTIIEAGEVYSNPITIGDIETALLSANVINKQIMYDTESYTTSAEIAYAYHVADVDNDLSLREDAVNVPLYSISTSEQIGSVTLAELRNKILETSLIYKSYAELLAVYDSAKTKGENLQSMIAALQAKGLTLTQDASNLMDVISNSVGASSKQIFATILNGLGFANHQDQGSTSFTAPSMSAYTGEASAINCYADVGKSLSTAAVKTGGYMLKIGNAIKNVVGNYYSKAKNIVKDYLGVENRPYTSTMEGDDTVNNTWMTFSFQGNEIIDGYDRIYVTKDYEYNASTGIPKTIYPDITGSATNWSNSAMDSRYSDYANIRANCITLSNFLSQSTSYRDDGVLLLLEKLLSHDGEILHFSFPTAELYATVSEVIDNSAFTSKFKFMIKWKPTIWPTTMGHLTELINNSETYGDVLRAWIDKFCDARPSNLSNCDAATEKTFIRNAKDGLFLTIVSPFVFHMRGAYLNNTIADPTAIHNAVMTLAGMCSPSNSSWCNPLVKYAGTDIANNAVTNLSQIQEGALSRGLAMNATNEIVINNEHLYDNSDEIILTNLISSCHIKYQQILSAHKVEAIYPDDEQSCNSSVFLRILAHYLGVAVTSGDTFSPYNWELGITAGKYAIQTDDQEANELAIGVTTAVVAATALIVGGAVVTKKLVSTFKLRKARINSENLAWTRADLANQSNMADFKMQDAAEKFKAGELSQSEYDSIINKCSAEKAFATKHYAECYKAERKANRKLRRISKWAFSNIGTVIDTTSSISSNGYANDLINNASSSIRSNMEASADSIGYIKEHV